MTQPAYSGDVYRRPETSDPLTPPRRPAGVPVQPTRRSADLYMTVEEVAAAMRVSKMTVYRLIHGAELRASKFGRSLRVSVRDFEAFRRNAVVE
jgi:excisionase family DNA binding protein